MNIFINPLPRPDVLCVQRLGELVDFRPDGDVGTYKWPKHDLAWEAEFYRRHGVEVVSARG